jgi:hypothetical protein
MSQKMTLFMSFVVYVSFSADLSFTDVMLCDICSWCVLVIYAFVCLTLCGAAASEENKVQVEINSRHKI